MASCVWTGEMYLVLGHGSHVARVELHVQLAVLPCGLHMTAVSNPALLTPCGRHATQACILLVGESGTCRSALARATLEQLLEEAGLAGAVVVDHCVSHHTHAHVCILCLSTIPSRSITFPWHTYTTYSHVQLCACICDT